MKSTGIVRGIDALGRIVLPKELRTTLRLETDSRLEIFVDGDHIVLKKYHPLNTCDLCGEQDDTNITYGGYCFCKSCRQKIANL